MKTLNGAIVLGIGLLMFSGGPARAQFGNMGDGVKESADAAAKQEAMKGAAEKAGLPALGAPTPTPGAGGGAASAPVGEPPVVAPATTDAPAVVPGSDTGAENAPVGEPNVAARETDAPAPASGAAGSAQDAGGDIGKMMPKLP